MRFDGESTRLRLKDEWGNRLRPFNEFALKAIRRNVSKKEVRMRGVEATLRHILVGTGETTRAVCEAAEAIEAGYFVTVRTDQHHLERLKSYITQAASTLGIHTEARGNVIARFGEFPPGIGTLPPDRIVHVCDFN